jgi:hypothetical protein
MASGPGSSPSPASGAALSRPHPDDVAELRAAIDAAERGELLSPEQSEAYLGWLETGEGPCPVNSD